MAVAIRKRLQARPEAQNVRDVGIDGEYTSANATDPFNFKVAELEDYILSKDALVQHNYPMDSIEPGDDESTKRMCERCDKEFQVDDDDENFMTVCKYHPGYLETKKMTGTPLLV